MKNSTVTITILCIIIVVLFACIWFEESELRDIKSELANAQSTIATFEQDNENLRIELEAQKARADELESQLNETETSAYVYHYNSYYDSDYDDLSDQEYIAQRESGQDYNARNGRYVGKYQLDESMLNGDYSPENQEYMAEQYMLERYGSWENAREFWDTHGWW